MLIELHAHHMTRAMFDRDPYWGPFWTRRGLGVGEWTMVTPYADQPPLDDVLARAFTLEDRLAQIDAAGVDVLVVSTPHPMYAYWTGPEFGVEMARVCNDELAEFCAGAPDRFALWGHVPMGVPEAAVAELHRAADLGARGIQIGGADFAGREIDDPAFDPLWEAACDRALPLFVHGHNQSITWGARAAEERYDVTSVLGMCSDEAIAFWNLVNGGVLDRFPSLQVFITHAGGYVPYQLGRMNALADTMAPDRKRQRPFLDYLGNFWFDLLVEHPGLRRAIVDIVGVDRLLYGSNFGGADAIGFDLTDGIGLSDDEREQIRSANAARLLRIRVAAGS